MLCFVSILGAVKITPAHDHNDFEIGKRHNLSFIQMIDEDGLIKDVEDLKPDFQYFIVSDLIDLIGTYAYYLRKEWVYALIAEGPL